MEELLFSLNIYNDNNSSMRVNNFSFSFTDETVLLSIIYVSNHEYIQIQFSELTVALIDKKVFAIRKIRFEKLSKKELGINI